MHDNLRQLQDENIALDLELSTSLVMMNDSNFHLAIKAMNDSAAQQYSHGIQTAIEANVQNSPFVCLNKPFVCHRSNSVFPYVSHNIPFVGYHRYSAGFTLIELMVTLSVVSILAFVAVPSISKIIKDHRNSGYANDFVADLSYARSEAIKRASSVTVCKTTDPQATPPACDPTDANRWTSGRLIFVDPNTDGDIDAGEQILRIKQGLDDDKSSILGDGQAGGTANRVTFRSDGTTNLSRASLTTTASIAAAEWEMTFCNDLPASKRTVALKFAGRPRVLPKGTGTITCP